MHFRPLIVVDVVKSLVLPRDADNTRYDEIHRFIGSWNAGMKHEA